MYTTPSLFLLAAAALVLMDKENFGSPTEDMRQFIISCLLFLGVFIAARLIGLVVY